ncbi:MAG TPA: RNA polymerase subunit sigma-70 [Clostridiales bacterium]|nr:RNA polymerase subunit sigma-70 [Clostridiales bacterium]
MILDSFINFLSKIMCFSSFVGTATGFPKPITLEEERKLVKKMEDGDKKARKKLIEHNLRLVAHIVKKYSNAGDADDLISAGTIGLIKGIDSYKSEKGSQLSTYCARCIENEILMLIRMTKKHNQVYSLEDTLGEDKDGNEITLEDTVGCDNDELAIQTENKVIAETIDKILKEKLSTREYQILCMRYGLNNTPALTQREVAKKLGISRSYISRLENKAMQTVKDDVKNKNLFI